jgi:hypothetical protein
MHIPRKTLSRLVPFALGSVLLATTFPLVAQATVKNPSLSTVISAAQKAMLKQTGVHVVVTSSTGTAKSSVSVDIGTGSGQETITSGTSSVSIVVTPKFAYLSGTKTGLVSIMGLSAAQQKKVGSLWVVMKAGTSPYESFQSNLTTTVLAHILPAAKGTTYATDGTKANNYTLTWSTKKTSTTAATKSVLTISSGKKTLPIDEVITGSTGAGETVFSKWGEKVTETAPSSSSTITYAKVIAVK